MNKNNYKSSLIFSPYGSRVFALRMRCALSPPQSNQLGLPRWEYSVWDFPPQTLSRCHQDSFSVCFSSCGSFKLFFVRYVSNKLKEFKGFKTNSQSPPLAERMSTTWKRGFFSFTFQKSDSHSFDASTSAKFTVSSALSRFFSSDRNK